MIKRRKTKQINIGNVAIGGNAPISVQSMCNTDTRDVKSTVKQKPTEEIDAATLMQQVMTIRLLVVYVGVPALLLTIVMGVLLWLEHPKTFLRMRWVRVKLLLLGLGIPGFHGLMASRLYHFRHALESGTIEQSLKNQLSLGFILLLIWSAIIIWLGRHKPRLWQNWAKDYQSQKK